MWINSEDVEVSIIIPVFNGEKWLVACIDSLLAQNHKKFEILVVDNNSNDATSEIIKNLSKKDPRIRYIFEPFVSKGAARDAGVKLAKFPIIAMIDSDCIAPKDWLTELLKVLIEENEMVVMGFQYNLNNSIWSKCIQRDDENYVNRVQEGKYIQTLDTKNFITRKKILQKYPFNLVVKEMEDYDLFVKLRQTEKIRFEPSIKVGHRNKNSLWGILIMNLNRGYWISRISHKNKKSNEDKDLVLFKTTKIKESVSLLADFFKVMRRESFGFIMYKIISAIFWQIGVLAFKVSNLFSISKFPFRKKIIKYDIESLLIESKKSIFIPIPKAACSSVKYIIAELPEYQNHVDLGNIHSPKNFKYLINREISNPKYKDYFKFTFVRNPWDRIVSCYVDKILNFPDDNLISVYQWYKPKMTFEEFVEGVAMTPDIYSDTHFKSQSCFVVNENNELIVDFVGKLETLDADFKIVCEKLGIENQKLPVKNPSWKKNYKEYYTEKTMKIIAERYETDIRIFGYEF